MDGTNGTYFDTIVLSAKRSADAQVAILMHVMAQRSFAREEASGLVAQSRCPLNEVPLRADDALQQTKVTLEGVTEPSRASVGVSQRSFIIAGSQWAALEELRSQCTRFLGLPSSFDAADTYHDVLHRIQALREPLADLIEHESTVVNLATRVIAAITPCVRLLTLMQQQEEQNDMPSAPPIRRLPSTLVNRRSKTDIPRCFHFLTTDTAEADIHFAHFVDRWQKDVDLWKCVLRHVLHA